MALDFNIESELDRLHALLDEECDEIKERNLELRAQNDDAFLEQSGVLARGAVVHDERPALFSRTKVIFVPDKNRAGHLANFNVRPGSVVHPRIKDDAQTKGGAGVTLGPPGLVVERRANRLVCIFDEPPNFSKGRSDLLRIDDEVTLRRLQEGLAKCRSLQGQSASLLEVVLGLRAPAAVKEAEHTADFALKDAALNPVQQEAARKAVFCEEMALIHGPPGTGKTRVLVEVVRQMVDRGERVLCLCASNAATDHLALSLLRADGQLALARAGHPARAHDDLVSHTLSGLTDAHELRKISRKLIKDAHSLLNNARKRSSRGKDAYRAEREARVEAGKLFADARRLERQAVDEVLRKTKILCGTLTGFARELKGAEFDVLVTDEASQVLTPALLLGSARVGRVVLAGDHKQLPPTIMSESAARKGLSKTAFERAIVHEGHDSFSTMLVVQHRMHERLMSFSSSAFYEDKLLAHPEVAGQTLLDLSLRQSSDDENDFVPAERVLDIIDTAGAGFEEQAVAKSESRSNPQEAEVVALAVQSLMRKGVAASDIGVITPYSGQVAVLAEKLRDALAEDLEIDSVDGFQGREKEVILVSLVRSNGLNEIGFVADVRRLNVAITRAKRKLILIGDSATLSTAEIFRDYFDAAMKNDSYRSVFELGLDLF